MRILPVIWLLAPLCAAPGEGKIDFQKQIRPILSDKCFHCHGPDESKRMAKLRLDQAPGVPVIVQGDAAGSRLYQRITHEKKGLQMPPVNSGLSLTAEQIELLRRWIAEGAEYKVHWAYEPPRRVEPPPAPLSRWNRNPIDRFLYARLRREGLTPSPEASRETLIRRVSLDLTGLPPSPAEAEAFLADRRPDAYERLVDRLLASPHYGERMAMPWLDLARYADTHGYHIDSHRDMWPWRDWVIGAFNRNLSFKDFIEWQLAGDLLPDATREQKIASGFNRNHMINFEGGAIPEEYQAEYVADRVETTSTVFLGMTMGCAKCHDHKYDPIPQRDFYRMAAFFNTVPEKGLDGQRGNALPFLPLPTPEQEKREAELLEAIQQVRQALDEETVSRMQALWEKSRFDTAPRAPVQGLRAWYELEGSFSDLSGNFLHARLVKGEPTFSEASAGRGLNVDATTHFRLPAEAFDAGAPFTISFWLRFGRNPGMSVFQQFESPHRGFEIVLGQSKALPRYRRGQRLEIRWRNGPAQVVFTSREWLLQNEDVHIAVSSGGDGGPVALHVNGHPVALDRSGDGPLCTFRAPLEMGNRAISPSTFRGRLDDLRIYNRPLDAGELKRLAIDYPAELLLTSASRRTKAQYLALRDYYLSHAAPDIWRKAWAEWKALQKQWTGLKESIVTTMVMSEMEKPRETYVLLRGDYQNRGEKVSAGTPAALPPLAAPGTPSRLDLARWLTAPDHPLTSRVAVNRFWQHYFGHGLVKTSEDFGSQGEPPVHPELLDWLASEFVRSGWDVKAMQRLIVTSAAYRQSSRITPALRDRDPENRLLARGPRFRLPAELVRDNALAVSGLLQPAIGGPSVLPYQPPGLWEELAFGEEFTAQEYVQDHGDKLWRRSMYTFWKRTVPPASLNAFDAPDREKCVARRAVTNTPLQALVTLNDPTYLEAARVLAQRVWREAPAAETARLKHAFRLVTAREASGAELRILRESLRVFSRGYLNDRAAAESLLRVGEAPLATEVPAPVLAAWTNLCSVLLNLDETITKE